MARAWEETEDAKGILGAGDSSGDWSGTASELAVDLIRVWSEPGIRLVMI